MALTPAQAALALGGTASAVAGGYGFTYLTSDNTDSKKPRKTYEEDQVESFKTTDLKGDYQTKNIISLFKEQSLNKLVKPGIQNKIWFDKTFNDKYSKLSTKPSNNFFSDLTKGVETASDDANVKSLSKACDNAYKATEALYTFENNSTLLKDIFDFCSTETNQANFNSFIEPKVGAGYTEAAGDFANGVLNQKSNRKHLVKTTENQYWWVWAYEKLVKPVDKIQRSTLFRELDKGYPTNQSAPDNNTKALNKVCEDAYKKTKTQLSEGTTTILNDIKRFCTTGLEAKDIVLPTEAVPEAKPEPQTEVTTFNENLDAPYNAKLLSVLKKGNRNKFVKAIGDSTNGTKTKDWWEWSYTERFAKRDKSNTTLDPLFELVGKGHADAPDTENADKQKALNQACDKAYKKEKTDYSLEASSHLLKNIADYCATKHNTNDVDLKEPEPTTWKDTADFTSNNVEYKNGVLAKGTKNKERLVKKEEVNQYWWKWAYSKRVTEDNKSSFASPFNEVTSGYDGTDTVKSLNQLCDASYKKVKHQLDGDNKKLLTTIKNLCSVDPTGEELESPDKRQDEPTTTNLTIEVNGYKSAFAKETTKNKTHLIDPSKSNVDAWWKWSFDNRFPITEAEKQKLPELFQKVNEGYKAIANGKVEETQPTALNQACKVAYNKPKSELTAQVSDGNKTLLDTIKAYCSKDGTTELLTPEPAFEKIKDASSYTSGIETKYHDKLSDPHVPETEEWWDEKYKTFPKANESKDELDEIFKDVASAFKTDKETNKGTTLNNACHVAYIQNKSYHTSHANLIKNINKYCTKTESEKVEAPQ